MTVGGPASDHDREATPDGWRRFADADWAAARDAFAAAVETDADDPRVA